MDNLKKIIDENKALFAEEVMLEGDERRFSERLNKEKNIQFTRLVSRNKILIRRMLSLCAAAVILVFFTITIVLKSDGIPDDEIAEIYRKYIVDLVDISVDIENNIVMDNSQQRNIDAITFEARPLMDILPDEMPKGEKIKVLSDYYSKKLAGVEELRRRLIENNI